MTVAPELLSVNVGLPKNVAWQGKTVFTGVWKYPVDGPAMVRRFNIDGDGQGDLAGHGGEQRAVLVYQSGSYRHWQQHFGRDDLGYGAFGENLTVDGLADNEVCIGDRYRIGAAEFEVTQPRWPPRLMPCSRRCRTPASTCSTARPTAGSARTSSSPWTCRPTRAPTSAGRPRS
jgi:MOSC domain-containing protein YiiM